MGRGSGDQRSMANQLYKKENKMVDTATAERGETRGMLLPQIQGNLQSEGYDPATKAAMTGTTMEAGDAAFNAEGQQMGNRVARTRNSAGFFSNMADLAAKRAQQKSESARGLVTQFAGEKQRRRELGQQQLASTYGIDTGLLSNIANLPNQALNNHAQGISKGLSLGPFGTWG